MSISTDSKSPRLLKKILWQFSWKFHDIFLIFFLGNLKFGLVKGQGKYKGWIKDFYASNAETISSINYIKQQHKMHPTVFYY